MLFSPYFKQAVTFPIFKKDNEKLISNYTPIALQLSPLEVPVRFSKLLETITLLSSDA